MPNDDTTNGSISGFWGQLKIQLSEIGSLELKMRRKNKGNNKIITSSSE